GSLSSPQISGRYSLGNTLSGPQIRAAKKPSSVSRFIARLSPKRLSTSASLSNSALVKGCGFRARGDSHYIEALPDMEVILQPSLNDLPTSNLGASHGGLFSEIRCGSSTSWDAHLPLGFLS